MTGDLILCDTHGCKAQLVLYREVDASHADSIARARNWHVTVGTARSYHRCPNCKPQRTCIGCGELLTSEHWCGDVEYGHEDHCCDCHDVANGHPLEEINEERAERGLPPLRVEPANDFLRRETR